jgi:hypothetical protein
MSLKYTYNFSVLQSYIYENKITLNKDYSEVKVTRDTLIEGKCITPNCENNFNKTFRQLKSSKGFCKICNKINRYEKSKDTCLKKYGVKYVLQVKEIKDKCDKTIKEKYGVDNISQLDKIKEKKYNTCQLNHGVNISFESDKIKSKIKNTFIQKYGVDNPFKSESIKETIKNNNLIKYGVENPQQIPEIAEKSHKNAYKRKYYTLPSGNQIYCQGYEPFALDKLINEDNIFENDIITGPKNVPTIWYNDISGKKHRHYVDIFIPSQNKCIEIKSTWTIEKNKDNIFLKQYTAKELGYNYEIWVYNNKGIIVEKFI